MAQFHTPFATDTVDAPPSGWTARGATTDSTWLVKAKSGAEGGQVLEHTSSADALRLLSWDNLDSEADVELLGRMRSSYNTSTAATQLTLVARASGAAGAENNYQAQLRYSSLTNNKALRLVRYSNGTLTVLDTVSALNLPANTWVWLRFRVQGDQLTTRYWLDGEDEPTTWQQTKTDSTITTGGWAGLGNFANLGIRDMDYIAAGTAGDSAPLVADTTNPIRLNQALVESYVIDPAPMARLAQVAVESFVTGQIPLRCHQLALEVFVQALETPPEGDGLYTIINIST